MKKISMIIIGLWIFTCGAEWKFVASSNTGDKFYIDSISKINKNGRRVWVLQDYVTPTKEGDHSERLLIELDCVSSKIRFLSLSAFEGSLGRGKVTFNKDGQSNWSFIPPNTPYERIKNISCNS